TLVHAEGGARPGQTGKIVPALHTYPPCGIRPDATCNRPASQILRPCPCDVPCSTSAVKLPTKRAGCPSGPLFSAGMPPFRDRLHRMRHLAATYDHASDAVVARLRTAPPWTQPPR